MVVAKMCVQAYQFEALHLDFNYKTFTLDYLLNPQTNE